MTPPLSMSMFLSEKDYWKAMYEAEIADRGRPWQKQPGTPLTYIEMKALMEDANKWRAMWDYINKKIESTPERAAAEREGK